MYLSKLEIIGFKSFAQKVMLTFDSGISAIVGPNGCGKTNIVDAIRWVLGEQRYSALRSERMEDVIFNGTKARKPLGMAEVSLVIENTKGILPSEYTQVTIGRRVYRSGESEYLLNKTLCRLKDILDLFMDTGMGADAYSVIELKMIETILSDKTDERRRLFEEAAGVTKYKHRRKAAYRKLEAVQADVVRVNDIVAEVHKAVNSLERQAKRAEQYHDVKNRLRTLEIDLMEREYAQLFARMQPLNEKLGHLGDDKAKIDVDLSREESRLEGLRSGMMRVETRLAEAQRDVSLQREKIHRIEEKNLVAAEQVKAFETNIARLEREQAELEAEREALRVARAESDRRIAELREQEESVRREIQEKQAALADCEFRVDAKRAEMQGLNEKLIALVHETADKQTEHDLRRGRVEHLDATIDHASEELTAYEAEIARLDAGIEGLSAEDRQLRRAFTEAEMRFYKAEAEKKELKEKVEQLHRDEVDVRSEIERKKAKGDFLQGLLESREGLSEGVRYLTSSPEWKPSRNLTIADAVHADQRLRAAVEAALGDYAGLLIVDSVRDAERGVALLKHEQRGKATFVCLDRLPKVRSRVRLPALPGVVGWAADLARYDRHFAPLFRCILDRVLIVDGIQTAEAVIRRVSGIRCVTLEGEIITGMGITRGGSRRQDEGGMIGKQNQIEELRTEMTALQQQLADLERSRAEVASVESAIDLKSFTDSVKAIEKEMNGVEMRIAQLAFEKKRASDIIARNGKEIEALSGERDELHLQIAAADPGIAALRDRKTGIDRAAGALGAELQALEEEWNQRSAAVNDLGIVLVTVRSDLQNSLNDVKRTEERIADIGESLLRHVAEVKGSRDQIGRTTALMEEHAGTLQGLQAELTTIETLRASVEEESARIRDEVHSIELAIKDQRRTHDDSLNAFHDVEMKLADLKAKADHIRARGLEEFEHTVELKQYPEDEFVDFAAIRDEIESFREKIKTLGNINFAAFEEYNTEKERFEFLTAQRKDLLEAEKTLLATIEEINATAQKKFLDTFDQIRKNFIETFKSLFDPGDECDLKLEEAVDPLEARIDIIAKPRGKRPTSIDLLSGGEKTLTATALLFAIYLVKPSPFCILDEVDAPLDDANIDRFTRILRKFSDNTQFIVVTHNKRTMEAANALYGVTMEEEGVSKLVTVRFNQGAEVTSAAIATA